MSGARAKEDSCSISSQSRLPEREWEQDWIEMVV